MSFREAFTRFWKRCFDYHGTASRTEFWKAVLVIIAIFMIFVMGVQLRPASSINVGRFLLVFNTAEFIFGIPMISLLQRRLNDTGLDHLVGGAIVMTYVVMPLLYRIVPALYMVEFVITVILLGICMIPTGALSEMHRN